MTVGYLDMEVARSGPLAATAAGLSGLVALVPARDEGDGLRAALTSLADQTMPPDRIIVVINNSTDTTEAVARDVATHDRRVEVLVMEGHNWYRKAGALNHGISHLLEDGLLPARVRLLLTMDGDTVHDRHLAATAARVLGADPRLGGVTAACQAKPDRGRTLGSRALMLMQRIEYGRAAYARVLRSVHTMAGAGSVYRAQAINDLLASRPHVFEQRETNLVEDYETTLALKARGWKITANDSCIAYTEVMPTLRALLAQRHRWVRGTVDEWRRYGFTHQAVRRSAGGMALALGVFAYTWGWLATASWRLAHGGHADPRYLLLLGSWMAYQALTVRAMGWKIVLFEMTVVPGLLFALLRTFWIVRAIAASYRRSSGEWSR
jgi:cellulose synthase/poly-beta-1,6-N-acetylglucosamine synthase-like glycosyltransferase